MLEDSSHSHLVSRLALSQMVQNNADGSVYKLPWNMQRELLKAPEGILTSFRWYLAVARHAGHLKALFCVAFGGLSMGLLSAK